jgi:hypothetical protein
MSQQEIYKLEGMEELLTLMKSLPEVVEKRIVKAGVRLAGSRLRTFMRRAAPMGDKGLLRKSITMRYIGQAKVKVGLNSRQYYKTLDVGRKAYKRKKTGVEVKASPTMNTTGTMIEQTWSARKREIAEIMIEGMRIELYKEAGRMAIRGGYKRRR